MTTRYPQCAFCGTDDSPIHKEDVIPKWTIERYPDDTWVEVVNAKRRFVVKNRPGVEVRLPCQRCNNRWLSDIESTTAPVLSRLAEGEAMNLNEHKRRLLTRWAVKTAMMNEFTNDDTPYYELQDYKRFYDDRTVPKGTLVFLAAIHEKFRGIKTRSQHIPLVVGTNTDDPIDCYGYATTFAIDRIALQIFSFRGPKDGEMIQFRFKENWDRATLMIYPSRNDISWPPREVLDFAAFEIFANRFGNLA